jgi:2-polyprenyl-6-methoxyphenol hydroxylase-like FAD-dependent oxidoreductase
MSRRKPLVVLGAGPVGLMSALRGRQLGIDVTVYTNGLPSPNDPPRVECVPAQLVALLVEFGVSPKRIGVAELFHERAMQWSSRAVVAAPTPAVAHVERPALEIALLEEALRAGAKIEAARGNLLEEAQQRHRKADCLLLDASGRFAVTAIKRIAPRRPLVARLFHLPMRPSPRGSGLMIAAGPEGYAYRLANATTLTIGVVGRKDFVQGDGRQIVARIQDFAPWLIRDMPSKDMQPGASGAASVQWSRGDNAESRLVGDASFARDALASQGLAMGLSDALKACVQRGQSFRPHPRLDERNRISLHCQRIVQQIKMSAFGSAEPWIDYSAFLSDLIDRVTPRDMGSDRRSIGARAAPALGR